MALINTDWTKELEQVETTKNSNPWRIVFSTEELLNHQQY